MHVCAARSTTKLYGRNVLAPSSAHLLDLIGLAAGGVEVDIKVLDVPQAVTAQLQAVGCHAQATVAGIVHILVAHRGAWIVVGHTHLAHGRLVDDGPDNAVIVVVHLRKSSFYVIASN